MNIEDLIQGRRTVHEFSTEKVPDELIDRALSLSLWSPNHYNTHPWRFTKVGELTRTKLAEHSIFLKEQKTGEIAPDSKRHSLIQKYTNPSHFIVFSQRLADTEKIILEDYASLACAYQNFSLFLWSHGVATKWSSGDIIRDQDSYSLLNIDAEKERIVGFIWVGIPARVPRVVERPNLSSILNEVP